MGAILHHGEGGGVISQSDGSVSRRWISIVAPAHMVTVSPGTIAVDTRVTRGISLVPGGKILQDFGSAGH